MTLPTVQDVLDFEVVRRGQPRVMAGSAGLDRAVRWVHVSELDDIAHLLRGGELVLTTGIALPGSPRQLATYVETLAAVGASGLVVELGRRYAHLPEPMVAAAEKAGLPLVALAQEVRFVEVTEAVHAQIVNVRLEELRATERVHQVFTELSVDGAGTADVLRQVARMAAAPAVLENLAHQVLACEPGTHDPAELLHGWEATSRSVRPTSRTAWVEAAGWLVTLIGARGRDWGRLVVVTRTPPDRLQTAVLERGAAALALHRLVERDRESLERQTHRTILTNILFDRPRDGGTQDGTYASAGEIAARAGALGVPLERRQLVGVALQVCADIEPGSLEGQAVMQETAELAAAAVRTAGLRALVGGVDARTVGLLLSLPPDSRAEGDLGRLAHAVQGATPTRGGRLLMAAGTPVDTVADARRSLLEARQVAAAAARTGGGKPYYQLPDVRLRGLLEMLRDDERLHLFVERELGALLTHDQRHGTNLAGILRTYLDSRGNKSLAATAAGFSRPAFYERLRKINQVLGVDLDAAESCLSLHVALLALDTVRGRPPGQSPTG